LEDLWSPGRSQLLTRPAGPAVNVPPIQPVAFVGPPAGAAVPASPPVTPPADAPTTRTPQPPQGGAGGGALLTPLGGDPLPEVAVEAADPPAAEDGPSTGVFRLVRTGDAVDPLPVTYTVSGTATPGDDYTALSGTATFDAGAWTTFALVTPLDDGTV